MAPWNPLTLRFDDGNAEDTYVAESLEMRVRLEAIGFLLAIFFGFLDLEGHTPALKALWYTICLLMAPGCGCLAIWRKDTYLKWRPYAILSCLWGAVIHCCIRESLLSPPEGVSHILSRLPKSAFVSIFFGNVAFPLKFRHQVILNLTFILGIAVWARGFCLHYDEEDEAFSLVVHSLGRVHYNLVSIISLSACGVIFKPQLGCISVVMFLKILVGILFPSYLLYNGEVATRAAFLVDNGDEGDKAAILEFKKECQRWSAWFLMGAIIFTWMVC